MSAWPDNHGTPLPHGDGAHGAAVPPGSIPGEPVDPRDVPFGIAYAGPSPTHVVLPGADPRFAWAEPQVALPAAPHAPFPAAPPHMQPMPAPMPGPQPGHAPAFDGPGATPPAAPVAAPAFPAAQPHGDPSRRALAAVITFIVALFGLWATLNYVHQMALTLSSVNATNTKIAAQLVVANEGLDDLDAKTSQVRGMADNAAKLHALMGGLDTDMATMIDSVNTIGTQMSSMNASLNDLDAEITAVSGLNGAMANKLTKINGGLEGQAAQVRGMRTDVKATSVELQKVPAVLRTTNARLIYVNGIVCRMGGSGITNRMRISIDFMGIPNGSAMIGATMIPPGGWRC